MDPAFWQATVATVLGLVITALTRLLNRYLPEPSPVIIPAGTRRDTRGEDTVTTPKQPRPEPADPDRPDEPDQPGTPPPAV